MNNMNCMKRIEEMIKSSKNMDETIKAIAKEYNMSEDDAARIATRFIVLDAFNGWVDDMSANAGVPKDKVVSVLGAIFDQK